MVMVHPPPGPSHEVAATAPFTIELYAFGAAVCCLTLLMWWAWMQSANRCTECGYCPVWCACDGQEDARSNR
jgi:hypothetical protein